MDPVPVEPSGRNGNITTRAKSAGHQAQHIDTLPRLLSDRLGAGVYDRTWLAASHEPADLHDRSTLFPKSADACSPEVTMTSDRPRHGSPGARRRRRTDTTETKTETVRLSTPGSRQHVAVQRLLWSSGRRQTMGMRKSFAGCRGGGIESRSGSSSALQRDSDRHRAGPHVGRPGDAGLR